MSSMPSGAIELGDFRTWQNVTDATEARLALADLRQAARETAARVPVEIRAAQNVAAPEPATLEAARQAVRLSETEFSLYDPDFHSQPDVRWTLEAIHDGAVVLHSAIPNYEIADQSFQISFRDEQDLTARIVTIIQSRLHRIRYVWPYSGLAPIVLRDSAFALPAGAAVKVQRITWIDPERNQFRAGEVFASRVDQSSFYRYELRPEDFSRPAAGARPDPLSNAAYRVIFMRPAERPWLLRMLTMALVACFVMAGAAAAWASLRRPVTRAPVTPAAS
jgi:hypothetical protein